jgi:hypothetical protein
MCRLLETIRVESKRFFNLPYHNRRPLIDSGELQTKEIAVSDISSYVSVALPVSPIIE